MEEHIIEREADMIAGELSASISEMLRLNQFSPEAKRSATFLRAFVVARCAKESPELAQEVERMLREIATILAPVSMPGNQTKH